MIRKKSIEDKTDCITFICFYKHMNYYLSTMINETDIT